MYYPIKLDKVRNMRYGMKAIHLIEKQLGKPIGKVNMASGEMTMEEAATLIWAGLYHEDKNLTPHSVMDLIDEHSSITETLAAMGEAFAAAYGPEEETKGKNGQKVVRQKNSAL